MSIGLVIDIALAIAVAVLFATVLALAREVGRLQVRLGPVGARTTDSGPAIGSAAPVVAGLSDHRDRERTLGGAHPRGRSTLVMFVGPTCVVCKSLIPGLRTIARSERGLDVVLVGDGEPHEHEAFLRSVRLPDELPYVVSAEAGIRYQAGVVPYGVLLDGGGLVRAKGLCNHMQQVESLLNAHDMGVATLSDLVTPETPTSP